jgi:hypothetical protein
MGIANVGPPITNVNCQYWPTHGNGIVNVGPPIGNGIANGGPPSSAGETEPDVRDRARCARPSLIWETVFHKSDLPREWSDMAQSYVGQWEMVRQL